VNQAEIDWLICELGQKFKMQKFLAAESAIGLTSGLNDLWVGAMDLYGNSTWVWTDGSQPFNAGLWANGHPIAGNPCAFFTWTIGQPNNGMYIYILGCFYYKLKI
jgi:hypothetical protein